MKKSKNLVPSSKYSIKCPYKMSPDYVTVHNTDNDAPAANEIAYMRRNNAKCSFHWAVDDKEAIQGVREDRNAWHAGDGNGKGNRKSIGVEICYSASGGKRFTEAEKNGAKLVADILYRHKWGISRVKQHHDWSGKNCPSRTRKLGWSRFIKMVEKELKALEKPASKPTTATKTPFIVPKPVLYKGKKSMSKTQIKRLQKMCNVCIGTKLDIDGSFGPKTDSAVEKWQAKSKAKGYYTGAIDGSYGPKGEAAAKKWYKALSK